MARETKADRLLREEAEARAYEAERKATYPDRLLAVLERATDANFELTVVNKEFRVMDNDDRSADAYLLTYLFSHESDATLECLEQAVYWKEAQRAEEDRKFRVKQAALAKLTDEERELLNV